MGFRKIRRIVAILAMSGLALLVGCIPVILPGTQDLSDFEEFEFSRTPALGFCPPIGSVFSAAINRDEGDQFRLEMSMLEEGTEGVDDCDPNVSGWRCAVVRALPPRDLTAEESERMRSIFQTVTVETVLYFPACVDPCVIDLARWDDLELTDHKGCPSFGWYLSYAQMDEIVAFLESLARDGE